MLGYSWNLVDVHGFDMVLSLIIHFQVLFLDILGVECWWILEDRWSGEHYTLQFCIARSGFCAYPVREHEREKLSEGDLYNMFDL